jgi:hypothetical protein
MLLLTDMRRIRVLPALAALVAVVACSPGGPLQVTTVQLGRSLNSDDTVGGHTTRFKPDDTIYVSVLADEPGRSTVSVRWTYSGQVVSEASKEVSSHRESATEFHLQNSGGFPSGDYRVDILVDGEQVASRQFRVEG